MQLARKQKLECLGQLIGLAGSLKEDAMNTLKDVPYAVSEEDEIDEKAQTDFVPSSLGDAVEPVELVENFPPGHGTQALGPSDSSDSGSDVLGAGGLIGDEDLDSDSDRQGTGERASAGRDKATRLGSDIDVDTIKRFDREPSNPV